MGQVKINSWDLVGAYPVCGACGSREIRRDAWAEWNMATREWELQNIFDDFCCDGCGLAGVPEWKVDKEFRTKRIRRLNDALMRNPGHPRSPMWIPPPKTPKNRRKEKNLRIPLALRRSFDRGLDWPHEPI